MFGTKEPKISVILVQNFFSRPYILINTPISFQGVKILTKQIKFLRKTAIEAVFEHMENFQKEHTLGTDNLPKYLTGCFL